jgi:hypothetical protein
VDDTGETFKVEFDVPVQITLHEQFHDMAWDHALKTAHERGVIPIGPIDIQLERKQTDMQALTEGQPMRVASMLEALSPKEYVHVTATMMVGSRI